MAGRPPIASHSRHSAVRSRGEQSRIEALTAGATDYLVKPFGARELLARVNICLEIARENRTLEREHGLRISAEKSEARAREELTAELTSMDRLHELSTRLVMKTEFQPLLEEVLTATVALQNADFGCVQLYNTVTRSLQIVVQQGFKPDFLEHFRGLFVTKPPSAGGRSSRPRGS